MWTGISSITTGGSGGPTSKRGRARLIEIRLRFLVEALTGRTERLLPPDSTNDAQLLVKLEDSARVNKEVNKAEIVAAHNGDASSSTREQARERKVAEVITADDTAPPPRSASAGAVVRVPKAPQHDQSVAIELSARAVTNRRASLSKECTIMRTHATAGARDANEREETNHPHRRGDARRSPHVRGVSRVEVVHPRRRRPLSEGVRRGGVACWLASARGHRRIEKDQEGPSGVL